MQFRESVRIVHTSNDVILLGLPIIGQDYDNHLIILMVEIRDEMRISWHFSNRIEC
jgi:hypothetical protein